MGQSYQMPQWASLLLACEHHLAQCPLIERHAIITGPSGPVSSAGRARTSSLSIFFYMPPSRVEPTHDARGTGKLFSGGAKREPRPTLYGQHSRMARVALQALVPGRPYIGLLLSFERDSLRLQDRKAPRALGFCDVAQPRQRPRVVLPETSEGDGGSSPSHCEIHVQTGIVHCAPVLRAAQQGQGDREPHVPIREVKGLGHFSCSPPLRRRRMAL